MFFAGSLEGFQVTWDEFETPSFMLAGVTLFDDGDGAFVFGY